MKKILNFFIICYCLIDADKLYFLSAVSLITGFFLFPATIMESRPDLFHAKIIAIGIGVVLLVIAIYKHIREGIVQ